jgi:transposase
MSARPQRIEVITRGERRRRWSVEEKQAIVEESLTPHASIMAIARKYGIGTGQLYNWRHQFLGARSVKTAGFARVDIGNDPHRLTGPIVTAPITPTGLIEIILPGGATVRVDAQVDAQALRCVLGVLRG